MNFIADYGKKQVNKMLSVKGIYDGKIIRPLTEVDKKANTLVIITFLEDDSL